MEQAFTLYERNVDSGQGRQQLIVHNGIVQVQRLVARPGGNHSYAGNGNPELVGKSIAELRGSGFRKIRMSDNQYSDWLASDGYFS